MKGEIVEGTQRYKSFLCSVMKGVDEKIDCVLQWFDHIKRMGNDRIAKRVYVESCLVD